MIPLSPVFAVDAERLGIVVRGLAVVGGAVLGGFGIGALVQVGAKLLSGQTVPRPALHMIRALAALATGWIAFLLIAGTGGSGLGGPGGDGILPGGAGSGSQAAHSSSSEPASVSSSSSVSSPHYSPETHELYVELLKVDRSSDRRDVFQIKDTSQRLTFDELKKKLGELRNHDIPKLDTVYLERQGSETPSEASAVIQKLKQWGEQEDPKITVKGP
jgi:hypothetical protein